MRQQRIIGTQRILIAVALGPMTFLLHIFGLRHGVLSVQMSVREEKEKQRRPFVSVFANCQVPVNTVNTFNTAVGAEHLGAWFTASAKEGWMQNQDQTRSMAIFQFSVQD